MYTVTSQERRRKLRRTLFFNGDGKPVSEFFHASLASARADGGREEKREKVKKKGRLSFRVRVSAILEYTRVEETPRVRDSSSQTHEPRITADSGGVMDGWIGRGERGGGSPSTILYTEMSANYHPLETSCISEWIMDHPMRILGEATACQDFSFYDNTVLLWVELDSINPLPQPPPQSLSHRSKSEAHWIGIA